MAKKNVKVHGTLIGTKSVAHEIKKQKKPNKQPPQQINKKKPNAKKRSIAPPCGVQKK